MFLIEAINFGGDSNTNGAVLGALAGIYYGFDALPKDWLLRLKQLDYLVDIWTKLFSVVKSRKLF